MGIQTTLKDRSHVHQQMAKPEPNGLTDFCLFVCSRITVLYCFICVLILCLTGLHTDIMISDFMLLLGGLGFCVCISCALFIFLNLFFLFVLFYISSSLFVC